MLRSRIAIGVVDVDVARGAVRVRALSTIIAITAVTATAANRHDVFRSALDLMVHAAPMLQEAKQRRSPTAIAAGGTRGAGEQLPFLDRIQASFGRHDVSHVRAHTGSDSAHAASALGARAYAVGDQIAFGGTPDLHTAAHEAAHVVQQRGGVSLKGNVDGGASDPHEQHADAVADAVVAGRSAESLLDRMASSGSHAAAVQRKTGDSSASAGGGGDPGITPPTPGIDKPGFIDHSDGANIRSAPAESGGKTVHDGPLPPATRVFVSGTYPGATAWWYVTAILNGTLVRGYVQNFRVATDLPEPFAKLHQVVSGDTAEKLAVQEYKASVRDGHDLRYYENVLLHVNRDAGRAGIRGSYQDPGLFGGGANNVQLEAGHRIWLVSPAYAKELEGIVPDGSLTNGVYAKAKRFAQHVRDIVASVTESKGHFGEVAGEYAQAIRDHMAEIVGVTLGFLMAEAASMLLAATPTGVGQIAAAVIQLVLSLLGAAGAVAAGVEATKHGSAWLTIAWTAKGDKQQIKAASIEFIKMLVNIAMAALSAIGAKGNLANAAKIANNVNMAPAMALATGGTRAGAGAATAIGPTLSPVGAAGAMMTTHDGDGGGGKGGEREGGEKSGNGEQSPDKPSGPEKASAEKAGEHRSAEKDAALADESARAGESSGHGSHGEPSATGSLTRERIKAPDGGEVEVVARGKSIVPTGKVEVYPRGKAKPFTSELAEELKSLKRERGAGRKAFDAEPSKVQRLEALERLKHNAERSAEMARTLDKVGLPDTAANNEKIIENLLEVGESVTPEHFKDIRSEVAGTSGTVKVLSTWKVLPDGRAYLTTLKLIPIP